MQLQTSRLEFNPNDFYDNKGSLQNVTFKFQADCIIEVELFWESISSKGRTQPKWTFNTETQLLTILIPVGLVKPKSYLEVTFSSLSFIRDKRIDDILNE
jgi:hypothetical protein